VARAKLKAQASIARRKRKPEMNTSKPSQPRVLLADDDRSVLDALGAVLDSEGFDVIRAANGHEAVEKFASIALTLRCST